MSDASRLRWIKVIHTIAWAVLAGCTVALPVAVWTGALRVATLLAAIVFVEVLVLVWNGWRCPLTPMAARYTTDRRANFDIFLPEWLARHNKTIFGLIYILGLLALASKLWQ